MGKRSAAFRLAKQFPKPKRKDLGEKVQVSKPNAKELDEKAWAGLLCHDADLVEVLAEIRPSLETINSRSYATDMIVNALNGLDVSIEPVGSAVRLTDLNTSDIDFVAIFPDRGDSRVCVKHVEDAVQRLHGVEEIRRVYYRGIGVSVHGRLGGISSLYSVCFDILIARDADYDADVDALTWTRPLTLVRHNRLKHFEADHQDACRLAKWWCKQQKYPKLCERPSSFLVELLARSAMASASASSVGRFFLSFLCLMSRYDANLDKCPSGFWLRDPCEPSNNVARNFNAWEFLAGRADAILHEYGKLGGERAISDAEFALTLTREANMRENLICEERDRVVNELREAESRLEAVGQERDSAVNKLCETESRLAAVGQERDSAVNELCETRSRLAAVGQERDSAVNELREAESRIKAANLLQGQTLASRLPRISHHARYKVETLGMETPLARFYSSLITESCVSHRASFGSDVFHPAAVLSVQQVDLIFNPRLQQKYELELNDIHGKMQLLGQNHLRLPELGKNKVALDGSFCIDCEEHFLLHGAPQDKLEMIKTGGLDPRRGGQSAGRLFGLASYLAINATKADLYTDADIRSPSSGRHALRQIAIVRVALGDCYRTQVPLQDATLPPDRDDGKPRDSVLAVTRQNGGCVDHVEVMVYRESQVLPVAIVSYKHVETCACALCRRRPAH